LSPTTAAPARDVAIVAVAQTPAYQAFHEPEPVLIMRCVNDLLAQTGLARSDLEFTVAGSCDYLSGAPFAFVMNIDGVGAWPPVYESHVEMDGAWALFEAWLRLQVGDIDVALVIGSGKSSPGRHDEVFPLQTDPYVMAPLGLDPSSTAGLQARALVDAGLASERDFAEVVARSLADAATNPFALVSGERSVDDLLAQPYSTAPLRRHDRSAIADGAAALVLVAGERARELTGAPVWIRGMDHRIDSHLLGLRDLTDSPSTRLAAAGAGVGEGPIDVAELMVTHSSEEIVLRRALRLNGDTRINPSGGPLAGDPVMATGLVRVVEAASRVASGEAGRALAHATSGPCLQQNLVCVLEGEA
jgi:acetyl-CoA acetyltransferase